VNQRRSFNKRLIVATVFPFVSTPALADRFGYDEVFYCKAETDQIIAEHHHDWSHVTHAARWKMISTDGNVFSPENTYSYLRVTDRRGKARIFQAPVPALKYLWISADSRFIVGVSNLKLWNPVQLVVFNSEGILLLAETVTSSSFHGVSGSITNWVRWYKEPAPRISVEGSQKSYTLSVEGNAGESRVFKFDQLVVSNRAR
jgi:hypothetical protein